MEMIITDAQGNVIENFEKLAASSPSSCLPLAVNRSHRILIILRLRFFWHYGKDMGREGSAYWSSATVARVKNGPQKEKGLRSETVTL